MLDEKPLVLLTRPAEENKKLADEIARLGAVPVLEPMLEIKKTNNPPPNLDNYKHIIFTSIRGVENSFEILNKIANKNIYVVGGKTRQFLEKNNLNNILYTAKDSQELQAYINNNEHININELLHISGDNIVQEFMINNVKCKRYVVYEANIITSFTKNLLSCVHDIDMVLFYSARAAKSFCDNLQKYALENTAKNMYALCISTRTAEVLKNVHWKKIHTASRANGKYMMSSLKIILDKITNGDKNKCQQK